MTPKSVLGLVGLLLALAAAAPALAQRACDARSRPGVEGDDGPPCDCMPHACLWFCTPVEAPTARNVSIPRARSTHLAHRPSTPAKALAAAPAASGPG